MLASRHLFRGWVVCSAGGDGAAGGAENVRGAVHAALPALLLGPAGLHLRHLDADGRPVVPGPGADELRHPARAGDRDPVRAGPFPRPVGRRGRRPAGQAAGGGVVVDRLDKRRVLYVTQTLSGLLALAFGVLVGTHAIEMWMVYLLALALGFVNVFDKPAQQSLISELVTRDQLSNAVTLNSIIVNLARVFGAALGGGMAAALGLALSFDLNALSFGAVLLSLVGM